MLLLGRYGPCSWLRRHFLSVLLLRLVQLLLELCTHGLHLFLELLAVVLTPLAVGGNVLHLLAVCLDGLDGLSDSLGHAAQFRPCSDITQVFQEVASGQCELGVVPLENSLQGTVGVSFDLFLKYDVHIQAELFSRISHCLLSNAPSLAAVRTVYSHPQPLAQCGAWLRAHLPNAGLVPVESTAAAAQRAAQPDQGHTAAIGHGKLADLMGLGILASRIEDEPGNWTRFVIIGPGDARSGSRTGGPQPGHTGADKTSLLFTTADKAGALSSVLDLLAANGINMRKLESRPLRGQRWKYVFFADVESDLEDPRYAPLLETLHEVCTSFRILGSYPTGPQLDRLDLHSETSEHLAS